MKQKVIPFSSLERILVCKLRHHGDVLLTSPLFSLLKRAAPQAKIDAYIYKETLPMLEGLSSIDDFILYDKGWKKQGLLKRYVNEWKLLRSIKKKGYDLVLNLTEGDRGAIAAKASCARYKVAFDPRGQGMWGKNRCYTHLVKECPMMRHTVETNLDLLRGVGLFPAPDERALSMHIPKEAKSRITSFVSGNYVVVHPVSRWMFKCTTPEVIARGVDYLASKGYQVVLTASPDKEEMAYNRDVEALAKAKVINLSGKINLKELGALIEGSCLIFCVDSVPMHMASAFNTPTVAIFGPTSEVRWSPWQNPNAHIVAKQDLPCRPCYRPGCVDSHQSDCLLSLTSEEVIAKIDDCLEGLVNRV